jgi:hypothetical protein
MDDVIVSMSIDQVSVSRIACHENQRNARREASKITAAPLGRTKFDAESPHPFPRSNRTPQRGQNVPLVLDHPVTLR